METTVEENHNENIQNVPSETKVEEKSPTPPPQEVPQEQPKKSKKDDRIKKDDKSVEQFIKSLNSLPTVQDKFSAVCKKYSQTVDDTKKLQFYIKQTDKRQKLLVKEKDQLQHEFNKTILVKSKLENLCRELQKQNKAIKEESLLKIREEEERRKETQAKFQNTLLEITTLLQQNNEKNAKLRDDNISMTEKFKSVVQEYQLREQQVEKMAKQMALEGQLADAKLQKANLEHQAEKERMIAEMEQMKLSIAHYRAKINELQGTETALRKQLVVYTDKYDEFQTALVKSSQVFGGFKEQMEMMSKKIKKLEKESLSWKQRWETSQTALLDMCAERQASEERAASAARQLQHMQSLCRTLQAERTVLMTTLKDNNIERPPLATPPPAPAPPPPAPSPSSNAKVDAMAANCAQLRQSLAHLQSQLNVLTKNKEESPKPETKPKKSKNKKNKGDKQAQKVENKTEAKDVENDEVKATDDNESNSNTDKTQNEEAPREKEGDDPKEEKVVDESLENLIEAINSANINLTDFENVNDEANENGTEMNEVLVIEDNEEKSNEDKIVEEVKKEVNNEKVDDAVTQLDEVNSSLNVSQEINSNDEVSHIPEVKPISNNSS